MRFLKGLIVVLIVLAVVLVGIGFVLPDAKHVERSITIARAPTDVFPFVNSFKRFNEWSPWAEMDPNATYQLSGPESGVGAKLSWRGDPKTVGTGSQEILESVAPSRVRSALDFGEQGTAFATFDIAADPNGSRVVWSLDSDAKGNLIARYFNALAMDAMIGKDYEKGLAKLKSVVEKEPVPAPPTAPDATQPAPETSRTTGSPSTATPPDTTPSKTPPPPTTSPTATARATS